MAPSEVEEKDVVGDSEASESSSSSSDDAGSERPIAEAKKKKQERVDDKYDKSLVSSKDVVRDNEVEAEKVTRQ